MKKAKDLAGSQSERFIETARAVGLDEREEAFDAALKTVARHKPASETSAATKRANKTKR